MLLTEFKAIFKNKDYKFFILFYILITILECIIWNIIAWSTYGGPGFGELEITHTGEIVLINIYRIPYLLGLGVFIAKMISLYRKKENRKTYLLYVLACISGIILGIIIFWLDTFTVRLTWKVIWSLIYTIREIGWVDLPIP